LRNTVKKGYELSATFPVLLEALSTTSDKMFASRSGTMKSGMTRRDWIIVIIAVAVAIAIAGYARWR
jgi:uncharacterized membrane protein YidH (DUF202 family)